MKSLMVRCDNGCKWVGELRSLEEHFSTCDNALVSCPNRCDTGNQKVKISRRNLKNHLTKKCPRRKHRCKYCGELGEYKERTEVHLLKCKKRPHPCQYCGQIGEYKERTEVHVLQCRRRPYTCPHCQKVGEYHNVTTTHLQKCAKRQHACQYCGQYGEYLVLTTTHLQSCPRVETPCPNKCGETFLRFQEKEHQSKCQYEVVSCKYKEIGCGAEQYRKDIQKHEEENLLHLNIAMKTILTLSTALIGLENKQITSSDPSSSGFVFRVREFQRYKTSGGKFYSDPFHTHNGGYKMCGVIISGGCGEGKGTHVTVAACLMKGDNDDSLTWPFTGTVTFELLNQLEDKNHHGYTTPSFPANKTKVSGRVVEGQRATGLGKNTFIPHTELDYNPDKNCQYLKDDTLVFRVSVEVPDRKPWLECTV